MKNYVMMIAGGAVLSAFADIIVPSAWKKYIRVITGFILLTVIMNPVLKINGIDMLNGFCAEDIDYTPMSDMVAEQLERNICEDIQSRLKTEFGIDAQAEASVSINDEGLIDCVDEIIVYTSCTEEDTVKSRLYEVYGAEKIEIAR